VTQILIQRLQDQVEQLKGALGADKGFTGKVRSAFGLEQDSAVILGMLYKRDFVSREALYTVLCSDKTESDWLEPKTLDVLIFKIRKRIKEHAIVIETEIGEGWSMPAGSKAIMRALVDPSHDEIVQRYKSVFGLQPKQARILALMMDRPAVTASGMLDIAPSFGVARVHIHRMRRALSPFGIEISGSNGRWSLSDSARTKVRSSSLVTFGNDIFEPHAVMDGR
jgi:hypothetical protein